MKSPIIIGSRGSALALWQARYVQKQLQGAGAPAVEIKVIKTQGDRVQHLSLDKLEGKGFFTKELEEALLQGEIDLAVHSHKDLPTEQPKGLVLAGISKRAAAQDVLLARPDALIGPEGISNQAKKTYLPIKPNARVGTSSARRKALLQWLLPEVNTVDIRGNVPTRVQKVIQGDVDATIIAAAGLDRIKPDLGSLYRMDLDPQLFIPAPAQGVLAYQCREEDHPLRELLQRISDPDGAPAVQAERALLEAFEGGCHLPVGAYVSEAMPGEGCFFRAVEKKNVLVRSRFHWPVEEARTWTQDGWLSWARSWVEQLDQLQEPRAKVFVSRDPQDLEILQRAVPGADIRGRSVYTYRDLHPEAHEWEELSRWNPDWIFFNSPRAVHFFFTHPARRSWLAQKKFACMGLGTAQVLRQYGYASDFTGSSADPKTVAGDIAPMVSGQKVLFPCSRQTLRSIPRALEHIAQTREVPIYEGLDQSPLVLKEFDLSRFDVLVFTSPRSARGLFQHYKAGAQQVLVSLGASTTRTLQEMGYGEVITARASHDGGLADALGEAMLRIRKARI